MWYFMRTDYETDFLFDRSLKDFFKRGVEGLVRENIQNSLDAKDLNSDKPVFVEINTGNLDIDSIPHFNEVEEHIMSLSPHNQADRATSDNMKNIINKYNKEKKVPFMSFEDSNTTGLTGVPTKDNLENKGSWSSYAYFKGSHYNSEMEDNESISGGSHGIGKISSNAASDLNLMYFLNKDKYGNENIAGSISLIEHKLKGKSYRGSGIFTKYTYDQNNNLKFYPEENTYIYPFKKENKGLKIIIPFVSVKYNDPIKIVQAVCDNFFVAILDGKLDVLVNDIMIDRSSIINITKDSTYYPNQDRWDMRDDHTPIYLDTYLNYRKDEVFTVPYDKDTNYRFNVYFQYDENIKSGRFAIVRKLGMTIENRKVGGYVNSGPFSGIIIPADAETDMYLKSLENASHTKLDFNSISNSFEANASEDFLKSLDRKIKAYISKNNKKSEGEKEIIDTSDMIYTVVNTLKKNIIPINSDYDISNNSENESGLSKEVNETSKDLSVSTEKNNDNARSGFISSNNKNKKNKKEEKEREKNRNITNDRREKQNKDNKNIKKEQNTNNKEDNSNYYGSANDRTNVEQILTSNTKRAQIGNREIISILVPSYIKKYVNKSDIRFNIINGEGNIEKDSINLKDYFLKIIDKNSNRSLSYNKNKINNASIVNGAINLELFFNEYYNRDYKYNLDLEYKL